MAGKPTKGGDSDLAPIIIIKRDEGEEHPHHGGAWKVAYADFVTAMMAFFLLMWLLNATTEEQRTGLADYFAPTNLFGRSTSGSGLPFGGQTPNAAGESTSSSSVAHVQAGPQTSSVQPDDNDETKPAARPPGQRDDSTDDLNDPPHMSGLGGPGDNTATPDPLSQAPPTQLLALNPASVAPSRGPQALAQGGDYAGAQLTPSKDPPAASAAQRQAAAAAARDDAARESRALEQAGTKLLEAIKADPALAEAARQLSIDIIPQGLRIQVVDTEQRPMFALGGATPTDRVRELMAKVVPALAALPNAISIAGHTDAHTFRGADKSKGNWELSADRANAVRRLLVEAGLPDGRVRSVTGNADRDLLVPADPFNPANRRITLVVLRNAATGTEASKAP